MKTRETGLYETAKNFLFVAAAAAAFWWAARTPAGVAPTLSVPSGNPVIIVLIDALRADALSCYGGPPGISPAIDDVAREGVLFENAYSNATWTKPSVASLFTGLWPSETGALTMYRDLPDGSEVETSLSPVPVTLAEAAAALPLRSGSRKAPATAALLPDGSSVGGPAPNGGGASWTDEVRGRHSAGFVNNPHIAPEFGFGRGFEVYEQGPRSCDEIVERFLAWQASLDGAPFFAYLHLLEPHAPYEPREPFRRRFAASAPPDGEAPGHGSEYEQWAEYRNEVDAGRIVPTGGDLALLRGLYNGEVAWADSGVARLVAAMRARGIYDEALVVIMADHGENFYEHGYLEHPARTTFEQQIRIPLIIKYPASWRIEPRRVSSSVQTIDVTATLTAAMGARPLGRGRNLLTASAGGALVSTRIMTEASKGCALRSGGRKVRCVYTDEGVRVSAIFDIERDGAEKTSILGKKPSFAGDMEKRISGWHAALTSDLSDSPRANERAAAALPPDFRSVGGSVPQRGTALVEGTKSPVVSDELRRQLRALGYLQ